MFRNNALAARQLEGEAQTQRRDRETEQHRIAAEEKVRADAMAQATSGLAEGLKQLSAGNLAYQLISPFSPDFKTLRADFNRAVDQLPDTLAAVATASIDSGSRKVSQNADDCPPNRTAGGVA